MKRALLGLVFITLFSCKNEKSSEINSAASHKMTQEEIEREAKRVVDSVIASANNSVYDDLVNEAKNQKDAPVEILKSTLVDLEYSNAKNIALRYKNVSDKTILGIKFEWFGENVFGEPADMGNILSDGQGQGFTDTPIKPGSTSSGTWNIYSEDAKTITAARAIEVVFEDGTKWKSK